MGIEKRTNIHMAMNRIISTIAFILFFCCTNLQAVTLAAENEFADKIGKNIKTVQQQYQKLIVRQFKQQTDSTNVSGISFLNIYTLYVKKEVEHQAWKRTSIGYWSHIYSIASIPSVPLNKDDLLTYIDPHKIDCSQSFLYRDSSYIGVMTPYVNNIEKWRLRNPNFYGIDSEEMNALYEIYTKEKPDALFEICQDFGYFFIKNRRIYAITYDSSKKRYDKLPLNDYINQKLTLKPLAKNSLELLGRDYPFGVKYAIWEDTKEKTKYESVIEYLEKKQSKNNIQSKEMGEKSVGGDPVRLLGGQLYHINVFDPAFFIGLADSRMEYIGCISDGGVGAPIPHWVNIVEAGISEKTNCFGKSERLIGHVKIWDSIDGKFKEINASSFKFIGVVIYNKPVDSANE